MNNPAAGSGGSSTSPRANVAFESGSTCHFGRLSGEQSRRWLEDDPDRHSEPDWMYDYDEEELAPSSAAASLAVVPRPPDNFIGTVNDLTRTVDSVMTATVARVDGLDNKFGQLEQRVENLAAANGMLSQKLEQKVDNLAMRINNETIKMHKDVSSLAFTVGEKLHSFGEVLDRTLSSFTPVKTPSPGPEGEARHGCAGAFGNAGSTARQVSFSGGAGGLKSFPGGSAYGCSSGQGPSSSASTQAYGVGSSDGVSMDGASPSGNSGNSGNGSTGAAHPGGGSMGMHPNANYSCVGGGSTGGGSMGGGSMGGGARPMSPAQTALLGGGTTLMHLCKQRAPWAFESKATSLKSTNYVPEISEIYLKLRALFDDDKYERKDARDGLKARIAPEVLLKPLHDSVSVFNYGKGRRAISNALVVLACSKETIEEANLEVQGRLLQSFQVAFPVLPILLL